VMLGATDRPSLEEAAAMTASYSDAPEGSQVKVSAQQAGETLVLNAEAAPKKRFQEWLI